MESPLFLNTVFPPVGKVEKKAFIPIRSITYKKSLNDQRDVDERKLMSSTMQKFSTSPNLTIAQTSPTRASTNYGSKPGSALLSPLLNCTMHKLKLGGAKESPQKPRMSILPELKTPKVPEPQASLLNSSCYSQTTSNNRRLKFGKDNKGTAQEDYFKLLFDENRKTFSVEECEGVDEFYTDEVIMKRIHTMGFRDPGYYATKVQKRQMTIPNERSIREEYTFKMPAVISEMENENTLATHVLGGTLNNVDFVHSMIESSKREMAIIKDEKKEVEQQIEEIKARFEKQTDDIEADFLRQFAQLTAMIKEDFVTSQNDNFKFQKEIIIVKRDQMKLSQEIEDCIPPLENLEDVLYGQEMFNIVPNDANLNAISAMNLRPELQSTMRNTRFIH